MSLEDLKKSFSTKREVAIEGSLVASRKSKAFDDIKTEFYINGFETLRRCVIQEHPLLDLSMFHAKDESKSVA